MWMCLRKSMYVYYFLKILPLPGTFLMNFTCTDSPASRIKTGFTVLSQCQFPNELYLKNINCADILLLNPSDSPKKNYFCYKSILPISIQDELGTPTPSSACTASLPPPSSSVSAGTKAEVTGQMEASCNPGGTCRPWAGLPCAHVCCASWAKKAVLLQQHQRQRRQPAHRVRRPVRATGERSCRDNLH